MKTAQIKDKNTVLLYYGIFFTTLSAIIFEISLTKIFSVTLWYHFAYFVVSSALFGLGFGGIVVFIFHKRFTGDINRVLSKVVLLSAGLILVCLAVILDFNLRPTAELGNTFLKLSFTYVLCSLPFCLTGVVISLAIGRFAQNVSKLYFFDLLGSAVGCLLFLLLINYFSGPTVVLFAALIAVLAYVCFSAGQSPKPARLLQVVLPAAAVLLIVLNTLAPFMSVKYTKSYAARKDMIYEKWSPMARITVFPGIFFLRNPKNPFGWGMSPKFRPTEPVDQLWLQQDAAAGTPITKFDGDLSKLAYLKYDITSFPYYLRDKPDVFIIGSGGGRDVLTALVFGSPNVHGCDIHPVIVDLVKNKYAEFAGGLYSLPQVDVRVGEGRNILRTSPRHFDVIQISLIDSWAATVAGAFSLAENNLYTVEAFDEYLGRLADDGILSISRYLFVPRTQTLRAVTTLRKALELRGVKDIGRHVAVLSTTTEFGLATVMAKKKPFTQKEIDKILQMADSLEFQVLYLPGHPNDPVFSEVVREGPLDEFYRKYEYDVRPTTDDRPFFFQMLYFFDSLSLITGKQFAGQIVNSYAYLVLIILFFMALVFTALFYFLPLVFSKRVEKLPKLWGAVFILIGMGFMFVEIPLLQKGTLYLGHPTRSLSI
ncbi:MAG: hypothetical protein GY950_30485, partial [bacterium]|nr:hypothetical protein [bacterium]